MIGARTGPRAGVTPRPVLTPFRGLRYDTAVAGPWESLLAPPHTDVDRVTRTAALAASRYLVTHLERPEYRGPSDPVEGPVVLDWLADGALVQDEPALYVLGQDTDDAQHRFLLASMHVGPEFDERTLAHEDTIPEALDSRVARLRATQVDSEPVLVLTTAGGLLGEVLTHPEQHGRLVLDAPVAGIHVRLWKIAEAGTLADLVRTTADESLFIADGHHRYAAVRRMAAQTGLDEQILVAVADQATCPVDLVALHRVAPGRHALAVALAAGRVRRVPPTALRSTASDLGPHEFLVVDADDGFVVVGDGPDAGAWVDRRFDRLGVDLGQVRYVADPEEFWSNRASTTGVLLPRPDLAAVAKWAASGRLMGRKTTSFRPKPLAGAVLRLR